MATVKVYDQNKQECGELTLSADVFEVEARPEILNLVVRAQMAAKRAGTHMAKTRAFVSGGGVKPWKQKGTGNARAGFRQSPVWRGGGVVHGPKPRSYEQKINKKVMKLAFARAFSDKLKAGDVIVVDEFKFEAPKTKLMAGFLKTLGIDRTAVVVQKDVDDTVVLVTSNLPRIDYSTAQALDVYTVLANRKLVCDKAAFEALMARIAK